MITHDLKCWPDPFAAILDNRKTYEIRRADRPFKVGDRLLLREWLPLERGFPVGDYTGRSLLVEVTHLTPGGSCGLPADLCVMAIRRVDLDEVEQVRRERAEARAALSEACDGWADAMRLGPDDRRTPGERRDEARIASLRGIAAGEPVRAALGTEPSR